MGMFHLVKMWLDVEDGGRSVPLYLDIYASSDVDVEKLREILARLAALLYENFNASVSLQQPILIEREG